jgi:uncharacterized RDD family membrane protein YckC
MELATRPSRLGAVLLDSLFMAIPYAIATTEALPAPVRLLGGLGMAALLVAQLSFLSRRGQTLGKRVLGIRVVLKETLTNGGFTVNVLKRGLLNGLLNFVPGYFLVDNLFIFREDRRCVRDHIAGTVVVRGQPEDAPES